jgi:hypothetical protein
LSDWIRARVWQASGAGLWYFPPLVLLFSLAWPVCGRAQHTPVLTSAPGKYERQVLVPPLETARPVCTVLDGAAAAFATRGMQEMTLWADSRPVPFTLTINSPQETGTASAAILNFHAGRGATSFDLKMPSRAYSTVVLNLTGGDFVAEARVSGTSGGEISRFVLFDETANGGGANMTMHLGERSEPVLHIQIDREMARSQLQGALVPPSRAEDTVFTTVAEASARQQGADSVASFVVPQGVPVERVLVQVARGGNFHRRLRIAASPVQSQGDANVDQATGTIQREDAVREGHHLYVEDNVVDAVLPDNEHSAMRLNVSVENGGLAPLAIEKVDLQMRQRQLCFTAWPGPEHWRLFYGSPTVAVVSLGGRTRSLVAKQDPLMVALGPEQLAANFRPLQDQDSRRAELLFSATMLFLGLLGLFVAIFLRAVRIPHIRR